ncbi:glycosyltransferase family 2 protein [Yeosuana marina]|uniref:glycosyltransferase family 2 protein n=1 Tax=Yeosuana marina TaxID=1565536 RepID=UPI0014239D91|nr:glycosyltransferase [Yeosuana marina]
MIDLSVHLITYNNEKHIEETLLSILKQKVDFNYEIVVGDDCSTDNTLDIINTYQSRFPHLFKVKKNEHQLGILGNFKATLDRCEGNYVFDIAGDDLLKHDKALQKMVDVLKRDDSLGFIDSGIDFLYEKNNTIKPFRNKKVIQATREVYKKLLLLGKLTPIGLCFSKKHLNKFVDFDTYLNMNLTIEDYPILVDLVMNTNFTTIDESLHIYRIHDDSYSHKKSFENHVFLKNQMKNLFDFFKKKYNYNSVLNERFNNDYNKEFLFLAGYFEQKEIGKETFKKLKSKSIKDYINYAASQNKLFRRLISIV